MMARMIGNHVGQTLTMPATATMDEYVCIYLSSLRLLLLLLRLQLQSNMCLFVYFAPQQSSINISDVDTLSIKLIAHTSFGLGANRTGWPLKETPGWNVSTIIQQHSSISRTQANNCNWKMGHDTSRLARVMPSSATTAPCWIPSPFSSTLQQHR